MPVIDQRDSRLRAASCFDLKKPESLDQGVDGE